VINEARDFGLKCGFSAPIIAPGRRVAICSLIADTFANIDLAACALGALMGMYTYERAQELIAASAPPLLSPRERECLTLVADGKSD
jgi:Autoinducer binding domain